MEMLSLKDAGTFHGHLGPYLTIGYMAGVFASEKLEQKTEFDLEAWVMVPRKTPYTCIVDGVQCSSKCTLGKGNIHVIDSPKFEIKFKNKKTGKEIRLKIKREVLETIDEYGEDMEGAVKWIRSKALQEIFEIAE